MEVRKLLIRSNLKLQCLCDYRDAYMLVKGTITITGHGDDNPRKRADE